MRAAVRSPSNFAVTVGKILLVFVKFLLIFIPLIIACLGFALVITAVGCYEAFKKPQPNPLSQRLSVVCHDVLAAMTRWTGVDDFGTNTATK